MSFFHQVTKLPYTACQRCNTNEDVYIVAQTIPESDVGGFICPNCLGELAKFAGYVSREEHDSIVDELEKTVYDQQAKINEIPNLMEKVIDGANNLLADFVVSVASVTGADKSIQPKGSKADVGDTEHISRSSKEHNSEHKQSIKPSPKSAKH
jgi:hypothetical protein